MSKLIYLIEAYNGLVKIGISTNPYGRFAVYRTHSPVPLRLIAQWPGTPADEAGLHARFSEHASHCEWFRIIGDLDEFVNDVRGKNIDHIRDWSSIICSPGETASIKRSAATGAGVKRRFADPSFKRSFKISQRVARRWTKLIDLSVRDGRPQPSLDDRLKLIAEVTDELDAELRASEIAA